MNYKSKAMLAASMYINRANYTKAVTFVKDNWEEILIVAVAAYIAEDIIDPDVIVTATEQGVL
jgi:hypothetical protein|tara:strand:- start:2043 stop:2231 length:189 start_codon:yes stop_codon:yes gene_type:complete